MTQSPIPPAAWFALSDADLQAMPDGILANAFTEAVKLAQKVLVEHDRSSIYVSDEDVAVLYDRLDGEIAMRDKQWTPQLFGGVAYLKDGIADELHCDAAVQPKREGHDWFVHLCHRTTGAALNRETRRIRCPEHA